MNRMKKYSFIVLILLIACQSSDTTTKSAIKDGNEPDSIRFGNVQPLLINNTPTENLLRIDSTEETGSEIIFYYTTDKGSRRYQHNGVFKTTILSAYKPDGSRDCFVKTSAGISRCYAPGCTIVIDTDYVQHHSAPYPLQPGADSASKPCPPIETTKRN